MRMTIFARILLAALLPLVLVFVLVVIIISNIIYTNSVSSAKEAVSLEARQIVHQFAEKLETMNGHLALLSRVMAEVPRDVPDIQEQMEAKNRRMLEVNPSFHSTWFAFEPGVLPGRGYVYQTLIQIGRAHV